MEEIWLRDFIYDHLGVKIIMTLQQKEILEDIKNNKFNYFLKSRQIGYSLLLCNYLAYYLIKNENKFIGITSNKLIMSKSLLRLIESIIKHRDKSMINRSLNSCIELNNGSKIITLSGKIDSLCSFNLDILVCDEFFNKSFIEESFTNVSNIIIGLTPIYWDQINYFNKTDDNFFKKKLHYSKCSLWTEGRLQEIRINLGPTKFEHEMDLLIDNLIEPINEIKPKSRFLQFRVDDNLEFKLLEKISKKDITLSQYLRELITKDLNI